jgi:hypothetical protein
MHKNIVLPLLCALLFSCSGAVDSGISAEDQAAFGDIRQNFGDDPTWSDPKLDDTGWQVLDVPAMLNLRGSDGFFWLRTTMTVSPGTAAFASSLATLTASGKEAMARLSSSMERVRASSSDIRSVIDAVNEFADQTNLLAMSR